MNITKQNVNYSMIYSIPANDSDLGKPDQEVKLHLNKLNRIINVQHANSIRNSITSENWKDFSPIEVNINTGNIIDGQHRWSAFTTLPDTIKPNVCLQIRFYDIRPEDELNLIKAKNTNNRNWTVKAFVQSNRAAGNCKELIMLDQFCTTHEKCHKPKKNGSIGSLNLQYGAAFIWGHNPTKNLKEGKFRGSLALSVTKISEADKRYKEVDRIINALGYTKTSTWYERIAQAWWDFRHDEECKELWENMGMDTFCANIHNNKAIQQYTNKNDWFDYFKSVGLGIAV